MKRPPAQALIDRALDLLDRSEKVYIGELCAELSIEDKDAKHLMRHLRRAKEAVSFYSLLNGKMALAYAKNRHGLQQQAAIKELSSVAWLNSIPPAALPGTGVVCHPLGVEEEEEA